MSTNDDELRRVRHSLAHLLAMAVREYDPGVKLGIGPVIDTGFYYDLDLSKPISPDDLPALEARMKELVRKNIAFRGKTVSAEEARKLFADEPYKLDLIDEFSREGKRLTVYESGELLDLCAGGHVEKTREIDPDAFVLDTLAGAYWRGDEKNKMLTRIYGLAFRDKEALDEFRKRREEAKERDHKKLGKELDLFYIDEDVGRGLPMWTPKGTIIKKELEDYTYSLEKKYGYEHVATPYLGHENLYKTSGHLDHYSDSMYKPLDMDGDVFYLRPMSCPHHIKLLQRKSLSFRDLPIRYAEIASMNRYEKSGELMGLIRVRGFELTDAHIFLKAEDLKSELKNVCAFVSEAINGLGIQDKVWYRYSKHDPSDHEKYYPDQELWSKSETLLKEVLDELDLTYVEALGEAAFYGPKLDVQIKNVNGKEDTVITIQIDFLQPERFGLEYTDTDGTKKRPVLIHRSAIGSLERTFAFLIEHYGGAFPVWLAPTQIAVLPIMEGQNAYAGEVAQALANEGIRVELFDENETLGKKIRYTKQQKVPYFLVLGEKESAAGTVTLETREGAPRREMTIDECIAFLQNEIRERR